MSSKYLLIGFLALLIGLAGCTKNNVDNQNNNSEEMEAAGTYEYYSNSAPAGYSTSAKGLVCFKPSQIEDISRGRMFCFRNQEEALKKFGFNKIQIQDDCPYYTGAAQIKIKNLTTNQVSANETDECYAAGVCEFNQAELVEVTGVYFQNNPVCKR